MLQVTAVPYPQSYIFPVTDLNVRFLEKIHAIARKTNKRRAGPLF